MISPDELSELSIRIKKSDAKAFHTLFTCYNESLFNFLYYKLGDVEAAEDIVQEAFVGLWQKRHDLRADVSIKAYLFKIAQNKAFNFLRHNKIVRKYQIDQNSTSERSVSPYEEIELRELENNLMRAVEELPEPSRVPFMLSRFEQLTYDEIAQRLDLNIKTVENRIGRALKLLKRTLADHKADTQGALLHMS